MIQGIFLNQGVLVLWVQGRYSLHSVDNSARPETHIHAKCHEVVKPTPLQRRFQAARVIFKTLRHVF